MSTWMLRICHIALTAITSKTVHRRTFVPNFGHYFQIFFCKIPEFCILHTGHLTQSIINTEHRNTLHTAQWGTQDNAHFQHRIPKTLNYIDRKYIMNIT